MGHQMSIPQPFLKILHVVPVDVRIILDEFDKSLEIGFENGKSESPVALRRMHEGCPRFIDQDRCGCDINRRARR